MIEKLKELFSDLTFLTPGDLISMATATKIKSFNKNDPIIKAGDLNFHALFVLNGLLRSYVLDSEGNEKTLLFAPEKNRIGSYETVLRSQPSKENIMALEASLVLMIDTQKMDQLAKKSATLMRLQNEVLKDMIGITIDRLWSYTVLTPKERYLQFCQLYPSLEQRIKQKYLASYLGVTATSLSRMRARLTHS